MRIIPGRDNHGVDFMSRMSPEIMSEGQGEEVQRNKADSEASKLSQGQNAVAGNMRPTDG